jgi:hypothetical protein
MSTPAIRATLLQQQESRIANLRSALADCGRAVGSTIGNECSDWLLLQVPQEVRLAMRKAASPAQPARNPVARNMGNRQGHDQRMGPA